MNEIKANPGRIIVLGRRDENLARCVTFDIFEWQKLYGEGTVQLLHQRYRDTTPYPVAVTVKNGIVKWAVKETDVAVPGEGLAELQYYVGNTVAKSDTYRTLVMPALGNAGPVPPDPEKSWVEAVLKAASEVEEAAKDAVSTAVSIGENDNWFVNGLDTGVKATGPQGERGEPGEVGPAGPRGETGERGPQGETGSQGSKGESGLPNVVSLSGATQSLALANNTDYRCIDAVTSLTVIGFEAGSNDRSEVWSIHFVAGDGITVTLPDTVVWNYGAAPVFTPGSEYWLLFAPMLNGKVLGVWNEVES